MMNQFVINQLSSQFFHRTPNQPSNRRSVNMKLFLKQYERTLQIRRVFGLCPFSISTGKQFVRSCPIPTIYTFVLFAFYVAIYPCVTFYAVLLKESGGISGTRTVAALAEQVIVAVSFTLLLGASLLYRREHCAFLNRLARLYDRWMPADGIDGAVNRNIERLTAVNAGLVAVFAIECIGSNVLWYERGWFARWGTFAYHAMFPVVLATELMAVQHVRDAVLLLGDAFDRCAARMRATAKDAGEDLCEMGAFAAHLDALKTDFQRCFGVWIVIFQFKDFLFLTSVIFYSLVEFLLEVDPYVIDVAFFVGTPAVSVILRNVLLVLAADRLERKVRIAFVESRSA